MKITFLIGHMVKERDLILYELAEDLGRHGAQVTIVSGYPSRRISKQVREYYLNNPYEKINDKVTSIRVGSKRGEGDGLFIRMLKYISLSKAIINKALTIDTDAYYIYSTPPFLGYYANKLKEKAPVLYNAQDLFPDSLKNAMNLSEKNPLIRILRKFEKRVYDNSASIVTISEDMKNHILKYGADSNKVSVIHNWADVEAIRPINKNENKLFEEFGIAQDKFTIVYAGDIGIHQRLDIFVEVAEKLQQKVQFIFFGNGAYVENLKVSIEEKNLKNFSVFPLQPVNRISEVYSLGDIDIVSLEQGMTELALPSKVWSVMAAGRPILALLDKDSDIAKMIDQNIGFVIDEMSVNQIVEVVLSCIENTETLLKMGEAARKEVCIKNARDTQTKKYYNLLEQIAVENKR